MTNPYDSLPQTPEMVSALAREINTIREKMFRQQDKHKEQIARLTAERDEIRLSYCSLMEADRGGDGVVTAHKLGWGYLFEEDGKPCQ